MSLEDGRVKKMRLIEYYESNFIEMSPSDCFSFKDRWHDDDIVFFKS